MVRPVDIVGVAGRLGRPVDIVGVAGLLGRPVDIVGVAGLLGRPKLWFPFKLKPKRSWGHDARLPKTSLHPIINVCGNEP